MKPFVTPYQVRSRAEVVGELRRLLPRMEGIPAGMRILPFGLPALDSYLPQGGLALGALHEVAPATDGDKSAALGFMTALLGRMPQDAPVMFIIASRRSADDGCLYGYGLNGLGLDPGRVIMVEAENERQTLWAIEEALHSGVPAAVAGAIGRKFDLRTSQRLHLAARESGLLLLLLRPAGPLESSAAVTRWRVRSAAALRDRFGLIARWRWKIRLERCRNGRSGEWLVEFDHAAHRFNLAAKMADLTFPRSTGTQPLQRAG